MSHQDQGRTQVGKQGQTKFQAELLPQALQRLLGHRDWGSLQFREDCTWTPQQLAATALLWSWSDETPLALRLVVAQGGKHPVYLSTNVSARRLSDA